MKLLLPLFLLFSSALFAQQKIKWPDHKKAVIVLTYDDALDSQLKNAIPELNKHNFKGTFFLTGELNRLNIPQWRAAVLKGHELANHTLYHPCLSTTIPEDAANASENYSISRILREIYTMNNFLYAIDGKSDRTFAYPCTETEVGGKSYVDSLRKSTMIKFARIGGDSDAIVTDFKELNRLMVPSYGLEQGTPADKLIAFVEKARESGGMGIFMFHGIGGDYITTSAEAHKALLDYLDKNRKDIWVATFQEAMDYIQKASRG